jgi:arginase family enzyme
MAAVNVAMIGLNAGALSKKGGVEKGAGAVGASIAEHNLSERGLVPDIALSEVSVDNSNLEGAHKTIEAAAAQLLTTQGLSILVGGDHSLTYPAFKAFAKSRPGAGLVVLDAHPDVQEYQKPPTHEDYLRVLIDEGVLDPEKVILIGVRNTSKEEKKYLEKKKIKNYTMRETSVEGIREVVDNAMSVCREWPAIYLSIDIDVLDPAFAPGTGHCEPGGLTTRELIFLVQRLKLLRNLAMADVVEVNPAKDANGLTAKAAAKIIIELS